MHSLPDQIDSFRADLHCHSTKSDGALTPKELIDLALEIGLSALSITDHDTIDAYEEAIPYAKKKGLLLGVGVELSCEYKKKSTHVLAYDFSLEDTGFISYCDRLRKKRTGRNKEILERLRRLRIIIDEEELISEYPGVKALGRPHIAALMVKKEYVRSTQEAFRSYIGDQRCCFVAGEPFPVEEALSVIHAAGGKAFLAHPHLYSNRAIAEEILSLGFDGLECYYGRSLHYKGMQWLKVAEEKGLLVSGGSDFHFPANEKAPLGSSYVNEELFSMIFNKNPL
jgi:3',5'-nucleoside bisphosphate phosphatase